MDLLKNYSEEDKRLLTHLLEHGRDESWLKLAQRFNVRGDLTDLKKRRTATNDIWRKFLRAVERKNLDLEVYKQTFKNGELLFESFKRPTPIDNIETEGYEVDSFTTNPNGLAWRKYKKVAEKDETLTGVFDKLYSKYKDFKPDFKFPKLSLPKENIAVLNLYDAHLDKIPVKSSTGVESSLEENIDTFRNTVDRIIPFIVEHKPEYLILPVGNDLFHTNGFNSQTKKGTQIEYYVNPEEAYYAINDVVLEIIIRLASIVKVKVIMVKGNHDEDKITILGYWLDKLFKDSDRVEVESMRKQRKYLTYGENLIGFAHGDKEKSKIPQLPLIMAQESKRAWGNTTYRKMFLGDLHHGFEYQFLKAKDMPGVEVEYLRSVGTTDTWHEDFGWVGIPKTAYLQIFDKYEGEFNRYKFNIK